METTAFLRMLEPIPLAYRVGNPGASGRIQSAEPCLTSIRRALERVALAIVLLVLVSCGGGDTSMDASRAVVENAVSVKSTNSGQEPASAALVAEATSLLETSPDYIDVVGVGRLANGGYTVVWCSPCTSVPMTLVAQRFDATGAVAGPEVRISLDNTLLRYFTGVGVLPDGSLIVAYGSEQIDVAADLVRDSLFTQRYDISGVPIGAPVEVTYRVHRFVASPTFITFRSAFIVSWDDGSYVVAWEVTTVLNRASYPENESFAQRFDPSGNPVGPPQSLAQNAAGFGTQLLGLTALEDGGYLAAIANLSPPSAPTVRFVPFGSSERTAVIPAGGAAPEHSQVVPLALGGYLLMSTSQSGPYAQILDNSGSVVAQPSVHPGTAYALADGGFAVVWVDTAAPTGTASVLVQRYDMLGTPIGDPTRAGPIAVPYLRAGVSLSDVGLALTFKTYDTVNGQSLYTQLLHEADQSTQQRVKLCRAAAKDLVGSAHRQFMSRCLHSGGPR